MPTGRHHHAYKRTRPLVTRRSVPPDILFLPDDGLGQQERGLMEDIAHNPDNPDRPDAWMWLFDDEDASRDATKKIRQMFFFPLI